MVFFNLVGLYPKHYGQNEAQSHSQENIEFTSHLRPQRLKADPRIIGGNTTRPSMKKIFRNMFLWIHCILHS
jgi:hypothetical protein